MKRFIVAIAIATLVVGSAMTASADFINTTGSTGDYYQYAYFTTTDGSGYLGGNDVDAYGNTIYVNRDGLHLDVYTVSLADTDGDGAYEPDQHPLNLDATGPMEVRTLTYETTYNVPLLDMASIGEMYAAANGVYFLTEGNAGISFYDFSSGVTSTVISSPNVNLSHLGYDDVNDKWFASSESSRTVYSWNGSAWVTEFSFVQLNGSHMDGLEVVTDPNTNVPYVYVSDMTSDYLGQWRYDTETSSWVEENLFAYSDPQDNDVEGMGFGALGHFWVTGWSTLYEIGGGDLGGYVPPDDDDNTVPEPATMLLLGTGLLGLGVLKRRRFNR